jgi:translation initiation factor 3 subunit C
MDSDSSSEDEGRVVKSAKDKAWAAFDAKVTFIRNAMKTGDWGKIQGGFDELQKMMGKARALVEKHGGTPPFYVRLLCDLEDMLGEALKDKAGFKKLSAAGGRALNRMKLSFRKYVKAEGYEEKMKAWRENPVVSEEEGSDDEGSSSSSDSDSDSDSDSSSDSEEEKPKKAAKPPAAKKMKPKEDEDSDAEPKVSAGGLRAGKGGGGGAAVITILVPPPPPGEGGPRIPRFRYTPGVSDKEGRGFMRLLILYHERPRRASAPTRRPHPTTP